MIRVQAIYHGKPIVGMPFFGDQMTNADKVVAKVGVLLQSASAMACTSLHKAS